MDLYLKKYKKYKIKYLKIKQSGGVLGSEPCRPITIFDYLSKFNCNYEQLIKIEGVLDSFDYENFNKHNQTYSNQITITDLRSIGFSIKLLKRGGFPLSIILKNAGISAKELRENYEIHEISKDFYSIEEFVQGGFNAGQLKRIGFNAPELHIHFTLKQLKDGGFSAKQLKDFFNLQLLKENEFTIGQLLGADFTLEQLKGIGFTPIQFNNAGIKVPVIRDLFTIEELKETTDMETLKNWGFRI